MFARFFSKKDLETIELLTQQFENLLKKSDAQYLALMGIKGKIKGLDIITVIDPKCNFDKEELKRINAKQVENYVRTVNLELVSEERNKFLQYIEYYYAEDMQFYIIRIPNNEQFIITALNCNMGKVLKNIDKIHATILQINQPKETDDNK
jgi:hypothetical protein